MVRFVSIAILSFVLIGCAVLQPKSDEQIVMERAQKRMTALQKLDFDTAYTYMSTGYRATKTLDRFKAEFTGAGNIVAFEVLDATCDEDTCVVRVSQDVRVTAYIPSVDMRKSLSMVFQQVWVRNGSHWGYVKLK